jgi:hypothetical protein
VAVIDFACEPLGQTEHVRCFTRHATRRITQQSPLHPRSCIVRPQARFRARPWSRILSHPEVLWRLDRTFGAFVVIHYTTTQLSASNTRILLLPFLAVSSLPSSHSFATICVFVHFGIYTPPPVSLGALSLLWLSIVIFIVICFFPVPSSSLNCELACPATSVSFAGETPRGPATCLLFIHLHYSSKADMLRRPFPTIDSDSD